MVHDITMIGAWVIAFAAVAAVAALVHELHGRRSAAAAWAQAEAIRVAAAETSDVAPEPIAAVRKVSDEGSPRQFTKRLNLARRELERNGVPAGVTANPQTLEEAVRAWQRCFGTLFAASSGLPEGTWQTGLDRFAAGFGGTRVDAYVLIDHAATEMTSSWPPGEVSIETARRALATLATLGPSNRRGTVFFGDFDDANLVGSRLHGVSFRWCSFRRAKLNGSRFQGGLLDRSDLDCAELRGAYFGAVDIGRATFRGADLSNARFRRCRMERPDFSGATLCWARFDGSGLERPCFKGAALQNARFYRCGLERPDFDEAKLRGGKFVRTKIDRGDFSGDQVQEATLEDCDTPRMGASLPLESIRLQDSHDKWGIAT